LYTFYKIGNKVILKESNDNQNITIRWEKDFNMSTSVSTCAIKGVTTTDTTLRSSKTSLEKAKITVSGLNSYFARLQIDEMFSPIIYDIGDKFEWHIDAPQFRWHNYTILLYKPQDIEGGELCVKMDEDRNFTIKMDKHRWTIVLLPLNVLHTSLPITKGTKLTLKGTAYIIGDNIDARANSLIKEMQHVCALADGSHWDPCEELQDDESDYYYNSYGLFGNEEDW